MLGFRGAARYISVEFGEAFAMECEALLRVRNVMGLTNVQVMVPFVRTLEQARKVTDLLAAHGLRRGDGASADAGADDAAALKIIMMCEIPSNAILATEFLQYFDGFSIGSNDLTQLTLGLDRDSGLEASPSGHALAGRLLHQRLAWASAQSLSRYRLDRGLHTPAHRHR